MAPAASFYSAADSTVVPAMLPRADRENAGGPDKHSACVCL